MRLLNDDDASWMKTMVKDSGYIRFDNRIDDLITTFDNFCYIYNSIQHYDYANIVSKMANSTYKLIKENANGFFDIEGVIKAMAQITGNPDLNNAPAMLQGDTHRDWDLKHLLKCGVANNNTYLFGNDENLSNLSNIVISNTNNPRYQSYLDRNYYKYHFLVTYYMRNAFAHNKDDITNELIVRAIPSMIVCILYLCDINENKKTFSDKALQVNQSSDHKIKEYLKKIVCDNEKLENQFINVKWDSNKGLELDNSAIIRTTFNADNIIDYIKSPIPHCVLLTGEAGTGKTTELTYVLYQLAKNQSLDQIPVFISLKDVPMTSTLKEYARNELGLSKELFENYTEGHKIYFLLDGLNEVSQEMYPNIYKYITDIIEDGKIPMIFTDRIDHINYRGETARNYVTLRLSYLSRDDKKNYFNKNCKDDEIRELLCNAIDNNDPRMEEITTPYMLLVMMTVATENNKIPDDYISEYIKELFEREIQSQKDVDDINNMRYLKLYLCGLAYYVENRQNSELQQNDDQFFKRSEGILFITKMRGIVGDTISDSQRCLDLMTKMGILKLTPDATIWDDNDKYSFANQEFQIYFENELVDSKYIYSVDEMVKQL